MRTGRLTLLLCVVALAGCQPKSAIEEPMAMGDGKPWEASGDPIRGAELFKRNQCESCHPGGANNLEPDKPILTPDFFKRFPTKASVVKRIREGATAMPPFDEGRISDADLENLIAYIIWMNKTGKTDPVGAQQGSPAPQ